MKMDFTFYSIFDVFQLIYAREILISYSILKIYFKLEKITTKFILLPNLIIFDNHF